MVTYIWWYSSVLGPPPVGFESSKKTTEQASVNKDVTVIQIGRVNMVCTCDFSQFSQFAR